MLSALSYNAAIFKVVTSNEYNVQFIDVTSPAYRQMANKTDFFDGDKLISRDYWNLTNSAWNDIYNRRYMSMNGDIYLAIDRVAFDTRDALSGSASDFVSLNATSTAKLLKDLTAESSVWLRHEYRLPGSTKTIPISVHVAHAFSEKKKGPPSRVQISLYFMLVVVTCNVLKLLVMAYILFVNRASHEGPSYIVTLGDAAASFLKYPDSNTQGKSTFGKEEMLISMGYEPVRKRVQNRDDLNRWTVLRGTWLPRPITFATGITRWHKITHTEL